MDTILRGEHVMILNVQEKYRHARQIAIIGEEGQERLKQSRVLISGLGGLGTTLAGYLAASGIGFLRIVDNALVDESNLTRQFLYGPADIGSGKTVSVAEKLIAINPFCRIEAISQTIDEINAPDMIADVHIVVDTLDNFTARHMLNRTAVNRKTTLVHGAVRGLYGQVLTVIPGRSACLRCVFSEGLPNDTFPTMGPTCGVIASVQATEVVKYLTGMGALLVDRLFVWNGKVSEAEIIDVEKNHVCRVCGSFSGEAA
jgi:molybdopterin-synthase adenylyltransferase